MVKRPGLRVRWSRRGSCLGHPNSVCPNVRRANPDQNLNGRFDLGAHAGKSSSEGPARGPRSAPTGVPSSSPNAADRVSGRSPRVPRHTASVRTLEADQALLADVLGEVVPPGRGRAGPSAPPRDGGAGAARPRRRRRRRRRAGGARRRAGARGRRGPRPLAHTLVPARSTWPRTTSASGA